MSIESQIIFHLNRIPVRAATMNRLPRYILVLITLLFVSACNDSENSKYRELSWKDLKPQDEKEVETNSTHRTLTIDDDWYTDDFSQGTGLRGIYSGAPPQAYSSGVVSEVDGQLIRVPGFVVPIEIESESLVTEFFLVPYFGACFHMPPPAPNQTIYVSSTSPIKYESIYDPVWIMGVIKIEQTSNDIAMAAYSMDFHKLEPFEE